MGNITQDEIDLLLSAPMTEADADHLIAEVLSLAGVPRIIMDREGGSPYLSRWYLLGASRDAAESEHARPGLPVNTFLHRFHRSDDDGMLHSHPWAWALAVVLRGGYSEERRVGDRVERRECLPGSVNLIRADDYHRVDLLGEDSWSLFVAGPKVDTWYFWDRETKMRARHDLFIKAKRGQIPDAGWQPDSRG